MLDPTRRAAVPCSLFAAMVAAALVSGCTEGESNDSACTPVAERCNGVDDDCDGVVDEPGDLAADPAVGVSCFGSTAGLCADPAHAGIASCVSGAVVCTGAEVLLPGDRTEECNGADDDCDGAVDEGDPGAGGACLVAGALGACGPGTFHCVAAELQCVSDLQPVEEVCGNGVDDDCDGADKACCVAGCVAGTLTSCDAGGDPVTSSCLAGCAPDGTARCARLAPSVVDPDVCASVLDPAYSFPDLIIGNLQTMQLDTTAGSPDCDEALAQVGGPDLCVKYVRDLRIALQGSLVARGPSPLVLVTRQSSIAGIVRAESAAGTWFDGQGGDGLPGAQGGGGGGAGYGTPGAPGGDGGDTGGVGGSGGIAGSSYGVDAAGPLLPGSTGGAGVGPSGSAQGGRGGGALALVACTSAVFEATAIVYTSGAGGAAGVGACGGGGGGGSGGAIVVEALSLSVSGNMGAAGGGGGGGQACSGYPGTAGQSAGFTRGGDGGLAASGAGAGGKGGDTVAASAGFDGLVGTAGLGGGGGGGGGAAGRITLNAPASRPPYVGTRPIAPAPAIGIAATR